MNSFERKSEYVSYEKESNLYANIEKEAFKSFDRSNKLIKLCEKGGLDDIKEIQKLIDEDPKK